VQLIQTRIQPEQQGTYFTLPFSMPPDIETFSLVYDYERYHESDCETENGVFISRREANIIDLGLIAPDGTQVGASGSDKREIHISETRATAGYRPCLLVPGEWRILVGAYKVAPEGVDVVYRLTFTDKSLRLLKGDLHTHTVGSDGILTAGELAQHARRQGLDFLAITDHNQMSTSEALPIVEGITLIPGVEWTHYRGHANFLGVDRPYDEPFFTNTLEETQARFHSTRRHGALITINHPYEEICPFLFDLNALPFDCLEIWNGPMREANLRAVELWQSLLAAGRKIPICGGSDYHRASLFIFPGGPTTCVYAMSASPADILAGLRKGHAYITFAPNGPALEMTAGNAMLGDSVPFSQIREMKFRVSGLLAGDVVRVVTAHASQPLLKADTDGSLQATYTLEAAGFARLEVLRSFVPGLPPLPALISNPIYFDAE